jgi:hypothetical protein
MITTTFLPPGAVLISFDIVDERPRIRRRRPSLGRVATRSSMSSTFAAVSPCLPPQTR